MYDVAIIGAGPAGITAAIYAARYRLKTLLISPGIGGWAAKAHKIENFPSHLSIFGKDLKKLYTQHVKANDIDYKLETAKEIIKLDNGFKITTNAEKYEAKFLIYALGTKKRKINCPGEDEFLGRGVALCATCDAPFFKDKDVAVIGGNDSGTTASLLIAEYANNVTIVEMMDKLPTEPIWVDKINENPKINVIISDTVKEITGDKVVNSVVLNSGKKLDVQGVFIEVGSIPDTKLLEKLNIETDKWGHIDVDNTQMSNVDKLYATGDITNNSNYMRQIIVAQAEGAIAAGAIYKRITKGN